MEKPKVSSASWLFAGTHFDRKRFAADFALFHKGVPLPPLAPDSVTKKRKRESSATKNKRKRAAADDTSDPVECFRVFKEPETKKSEVDLSKAGTGKDEDVEVEVERRRKEAEREIERAAVLRKRFAIKISEKNVPPPLENFQELVTRYDCDPYLVGTLSKLGFEEPTAIQRQAISILLSGRGCFACAPTGSGKTLAFLIPMLMKIKVGSKEGVKGLIICPTRELAAQSTRVCKKLAKGRKFVVKLMTKDLSRDGNFKDMRCDILVSTPLRLRHAAQNRDLDLSRVEHLVLDESDKLFELGFVEVIDSIIKACSNPSIVRSLFSATLPETIENLARTIMHDAVRVIVGRKNSASVLVQQKLVFTGSESGKLIALRQRFAQSLNPPVLIFVQSKERAKELYKELVLEDIRADVIHADLNEEQRQDTVDNFRAGKTWVLIATEVLGRGMDFKGVNCVINYDFPESVSAYIHRIGRSGRAGRAGEAVTFFTESDRPFLRNIANVMASSGCEVPSWIMELPKLRGRKHRINRGPNLHF